MRAPTRLSAVNLLQLHLTLIRFPKRAEVVIKFGERRKLLAQLTGTDVAVIIDHGRRLTGRAGKGPGRGLAEVCVLRAIVSRYRTYVSHSLKQALAGIVVAEHPIGITPG